MLGRRTGAPLAVALAVVLLPAAGTSVATAEPRPSLAQVQRQLDALNVKIDNLNEDFTGAKLQLSGARRDQARSLGRVRRAQQELGQAQKDMSAFVAAAYRNGGAGQMAQLLSNGNPQTFLDRAGALNRIADGQSAKLAAARTAKVRLRTEQASASKQAAAVAAVTSQLSEQRASIEAAIDQQEKILAGLQADERRRLEEARLADARRSAAAARATRTRAVVAEPEQTYSGPASGRAAIAVQEAYRKLGSPYQWAAAGPDRFDCSGLTMWVWGKAGVSLPHQSRAQFAGGRKVAKSDLQPGDLTFYGDPIHHVGVYVGNGQMISAPQTGDVVKLQNALRKDYVGAVRP